MKDEPKTVPVPLSPEEAPTSARPSSTNVGTADTWIRPSSREQEELTAPPSGRTLAGRYMVLEQLGQGGMGVVVAAYDTRLDRRVALKLLRSEPSLEASTSNGEIRLVREAQAMARLNHPHVVAVYDAGSLEDGSLFIAMEYVEGETLRGWCERQKRSWRQVLSAYVSAGRGLAAAHASGLIHRDFKPDNVLVGKDGRVRVTDFGLARTHSGNDSPEQAPPTAASEALDSARTETGQLMGTPKYMAPELLRGEPAGVPTDLYAFCVSLYEALYEQLPFAGQNTAEYSLARREGRVTPPPAQSQVPAWVARAVMQGLRVEPLERPVSMEALLSTLDNDPEVKRQSQRRLAAVAVGGVLLAGLAVWGWARQQRQEPVCGQVARRLDGVWDATVKTRLSEALLGTGVPYAHDTVARVSTVLDGYAERWVQQSRALCEAEQNVGPSRLAALRESCLERRRSQLRATTELLSRDADRALLDKATQAVRSLPPLEDCADNKVLTATVPPPEDPAVRAQVESLLEKVDRVEARLSAGKYKEGLAQAEPLLREVEPLGYAPLRAQVLFQLARLKDGAGDYKGAEELIRKTLTTAATGKDLPLMSRALSHLIVTVGVEQDRPQEAAPLEPAVEAVAESTGDELIRATALHNLGALLKTRGRYLEAREKLTQAFTLREKLLGPEHPETAATQHQLASVTWWLGNYDQALREHERALALKTKALGPEHPDTINAINGVAAVLRDLGKYEEARQRLEQVLKLREKILGPDHPLVATSLGNLSILLIDTGQYEEALKLTERTLALKEKQLGREDPDLAGTLINMGNALGYLGRHKEAREQHARALALSEKALGPDHPLVGLALTVLSSELLSLGRHGEAQQRINRAQAILEKALGKEHPDLAYVLVVQGELRLERKKHAEAVPLLERALKLAPKGGALVEVQYALARALGAGKKAKPSERARAVALATEARDAWQKFGHATKAADASKWLAAHPSP
jgi:tetratricopeptide (TPR) repeat protein